MTLENFASDFIYHTVLFIYVLICVMVSTINYKGKILQAIAMAVILPFAILIFAPLLQPLYKQDNFLAISVAAVLADLLAVYYVHRNFMNEENH